ncbi:MAG: S8 family serine peptidase, partial [Thermoplasmatota archaeon]
MNGRAFAIASILILLPAALPGQAAADDVPSWFAGHEPAWITWQDASDKLPEDAEARLDYATTDGRLRVMVALDERASWAEAFVDELAPRAGWYHDTFDSANFWAEVGPRQLSMLLAHADVRFVDPDYPLTYFLAEATTDVDARSQTGTGTGVWYFDTSTSTFKSDISGVSTAYTGDGIRVAVIDSGIDSTHKDFGSIGCSHGIYEPCNSRIVYRATIEPFVGSTLGSPLQNLPTSDLASGHGTHVAGIIAGNGYYSWAEGATHPSYGGDGLTFGIAPEADLISIKSGDSISAAFAADALSHASAYRNAYNIQVVSNSWGCNGGCPFSPTSTISNLVRGLYNAGVVLTFAAGNDGGSGGGSEFSGYAQSPYVIGVAAYEDANDRLASFSSRGSSGTSNSLPTATTWTPATDGINAANARRPDIAAPGVNIQSARDLTAGTRVWTGDADAGG